MLSRKIRHRLVKLSSKMRVQYYRFMGIKIGKKCFISRKAQLDARRGKISIGDNVAISGGCWVLSHVGFQPSKEGEDETIIQDNVKIFVNSVILPGVKVGKNSIIGAGSIVMKDVPQNVIVMGNPARIVQRL